VKIGAELWDSGGIHQERSYTLSEAVALVRSFLKSGAMVVIRSPGGRIVLESERGTRGEEVQR
jgi:hypothetical protein